MSHYDFFLNFPNGRKLEKDLNSINMYVYDCLHLFLIPPSVRYAKKLSTATIYHLNTKMQCDKPILDRNSS